MREASQRSIRKKTTVGVKRFHDWVATKGLALGSWRQADLSEPSGAVGLTLVRGDGERSGLQ